MGVRGRAESQKTREGIGGWIPHEQVEEQSIAATERGCVQRTSRSA